MSTRCSEMNVEESDRRSEMIGVGVIDVAAIVRN